MTKNEITNEILAFKRVLVYEPQLTSFEKNLLYKIKDRDLRAFAISELKSLKSQIKKGVYTENEKSITPFKKDSNSNKKQHTDKSILNSKPSGKMKKYRTIGIEANPEIQIEFDYINSSFIDLAKYLGISVDRVKNALKTTDKNFVFNAQNLISSGIWLLLKPFVEDMIKLKVTKEKRSKIEATPKIKKTSPVSPPLPEFASRNIFKMISIAKKS